jgi:drug/metabolite transporter (DMT)-like permease
VTRLAGFAFLLNTLLFATYYAVAKEALGRIDPVVFSCCEMTSLVPLALCVLLVSWKDVSKAVVKRGVILGSCLYLALITIAIALKYTTATSTAFFPSLNGFLAAIIAWFFLRTPIGKFTWLAGVLSVVGTMLLVMNSSWGNWRGSLIAFLGGVFFTSYVFLADREQKDEIAPWPLFGVELLTMALWSNLVVLLFGDWRAVHPSLPHDLWVVFYVALACTFIPTLITVLMQKHISPVTVSFIYILEPILGAVVAMLYLHEMLPVAGYAGGLLVVVGALLHTWGSSRQAAWSLEPGSPAVQLQQRIAPWVGKRRGDTGLVRQRRRDRAARLARSGVAVK